MRHLKPRLACLVGPSLVASSALGQMAQQQHRGVHLEGEERGGRR